MCILHTTLPLCVPVIGIYRVFRLVCVKSKIIHGVSGTPGPIIGCGEFLNDVLIPK